MAQLAVRSVVNALSKRTVPVFTAHRTLATEASPEDYGYYPDPLEHATGREKKMLLARLAGDDVCSIVFVFYTHFSRDTSLRFTTALKLPLRKSLILFLPIIPTESLDACVSIFTLLLLLRILGILVNGSFF